jgi:beta-lactamase class A
MQRCDRWRRRFGCSSPRITGGSCQPIHAIDPTTPAPLASTVKLYVLDALGNAVASGRIAWNQRLTVTAKLKSLPSGELQQEPDGTRIPVRAVAAKMISLSDNTAADMLINLLGRPAVAAALSRAGMASPGRDRPFLTTRELFILKLDQWPTLAHRYAAATEAGRRTLLARTIDAAPLPAMTAARSWTEPRDIDGIEWFASADDLCRVYTSSPSWRTGPVSPRSPAWSRSTTAVSGSIHLSGGPPGSREETRPAS